MNTRTSTNFCDIHLSRSRDVMGRQYPRLPTTTNICCLLSQLLDRLQLVQCPSGLQCQCNVDMSSTSHHPSAVCAGCDCLSRSHSGACVPLPSASMAKHPLTCRLIWSALHLPTSAHCSDYSATTSALVCRHTQCTHRRWPCLCCCCTCCLKQPVGAVLASSQGWASLMLLGP